MEKNKIGILVPVFNEENTLPKLLPDLKKIGNVLVVNDGSTDNSQNIVNKFKCNYINHKKNLGYEKSIINGFKYFVKTKCQYILTFDADGQHRVKDIKKILKYINKADMIICNRHRLNRVAEYLLDLIFFIKFKIKDPISGMKIYNVQKLKKIKLNSFKKIYMIDLVLFFIYSDYTIKNIKIKTKPRFDSPRIGNVIKTNMRIFLISIKLLLNILNKKNVCR